MLTGVVWIVAMRKLLMKEQSGIETTYNEILTILSVSPKEEDHSSLEAILGHSRWTLLKADKLRIPRDVDQRSELMSITIPK